jgi:hypothetical protein
MHCPKCGQQQVSDETRFCSRCGLPLSGIAEIVANGGIVKTQKTGIAGSADSPKRRGVKKGVFIFLLSFLVVPLLAMLTLVLNIKPFLPAIGAFLFGIGGLLRIVYDLLFESGEGSIAFSSPSVLTGADTRAALPGSQSIPASAYSAPSGSWRDTNDLLQQPGSVTDSTTKLLQNDGQDQ